MTLHVDGRSWFIAVLYEILIVCSYTTPHDDDTKEGRREKKYHT